MNIVLLGAPGSGKGSQAELLVRDFGLVQISTGDLLRSAISNNTAEGRLAKKYVQEGGLVPDDLVFKILKLRVEQPDAANGVIFDGYPRTLQQAEMLGSYLDSKGKKLDTAINISSSFNVVVKRLLSRRLCESCGKGYNMISSPPKSDKCDDCGGKIISRNDDNETVIKNRLDIYCEVTKPLMEYYFKKGILSDVNGDRGIDEVYQEIKHKLTKK